MRTQKSTATTSFGTKQGETNEEARISDISSAFGDRRCDRADRYIDIDTVYGSKHIVFKHIDYNTEHNGPNNTKFDSNSELDRLDNTKFHDNS